jgi:hypothetical protein
MTSNFYGGQNITQYGPNSVGINSGTVNNNSQQDTLRELVDAVNALRGQVSPTDREVIDASMRNVGTGVERQPLRQALGQIAGIATVVGQVGVPVVEAVRKVMAAFGM